MGHNEGKMERSSGKPTGSTPINTGELMNLPPVSLIINNFNGTAKLEICLSSIQDTVYPSFEVIVSDCVTHGIEDWMGKFFPQAKLLSFKSDIGPAASRNAGLLLCDPSSKIVVFLDNDTKVHPLWLRNLVKVLEKSDDIGAAQSLLLKMGEPEKIDSLGGFFDYIGYVCLPTNFSVYSEAPQKMRDICFCEAITAVKKTVLGEFPDPGEPYDPEYFQHWEDVDMCWNIMLLGYRVVLAPKSIVYHTRGVSSGLGKQTDRTVYLNTRNRLTTLIKDYNIWNLLNYLPITFLFEVIKATLLLVRKREHAYATFKGLLWNIFNLKLTWKKRIKVQKYSRRVGDTWIKRRLFKPSLTRLIRDYKRNYYQGASAFKNYGNPPKG